MNRIFIFKCRGCQSKLQSKNELISHHNTCGRNIQNSTFDELKKYFNEVLNIDKSTYQSSNDEPTPIGCIEEMLQKIPTELWSRTNLRILDPCCGNGNFAIPVIQKLQESPSYNNKTILEEVLYFNDINEARLENVRSVFCGRHYNLNVSNSNFLEQTQTNADLFDLIMANPPYAKLMENGQRASKNHNLIKDFIEMSLSKLKPDGYLLFITPDNWMSYADRNLLISKLTSLQIIHLDIHSSKKYFKKIGSSFTWYIIQNRPAYKPMNVSGVWKGKAYSGTAPSKPRKFIPLVYNETVDSILTKTLDSIQPKFDVKTSSDLHKFTKRALIQDHESASHPHKLIHTPSQTVYANRPHKFQEGYKAFISTTDKYSVFVDNCGMTQSIAFIQCKSREEAEDFKKILEHPLYVFINNICRWGNFNNVRILQNFPIPSIPSGFSKHWTEDDIFDAFQITEQEKKYIKTNL